MASDSRVSKLEEPILGKLPPRDRLRMILEAGTRREAAAVRRLMETCPRGVYRMPRADFTDRMNDARRLATLGANITGQTFYAFSLVDLFESAEKELATGTPEIDIPRADLLRQLREKILLDFKASWTAYDGLSREACGVSGLELIGGLPMYSGWRLPDETLEAIEGWIGAEVPEEDREDLAELTDFWTRTMKEAFTQEEAA